LAYSNLFAFVIEFSKRPNNTSLFSAFCKTMVEQYLKPVIDFFEQMLIRTFVNPDNPASQYFYQTFSDQGYIRKLMKSARTIKFTQLMHDVDGDIVRLSDMCTIMVYPYDTDDDENENEDIETCQEESLEEGDATTDLCSLQGVSALPLSPAVPSESLDWSKYDNRDSSFAFMYQMAASVPYLKTNERTKFEVGIVQASKEDKNDEPTYIFPRHPTRHLDSSP
ncbi:hypothetical protein L9F63_010167, partial [Diploptera punctata]